MKYSLKWDIFETQNGSTLERFEDWIATKQNGYTVLSAHKQNLTLKRQPHKMVNILTIYSNKF